MSCPNNRLELVQQDQHLSLEQLLVRVFLAWNKTSCPRPAHHHLVLVLVLVLLLLLLLLVIQEPSSPFLDWKMQSWRKAAVLRPLRLAAWACRLLQLPPWPQLGLVSSRRLWLP